MLRFAFSLYANNQIARLFWYVKIYVKISRKCHKYELQPSLGTKRRKRWGINKDKTNANYETTDAQRRTTTENGGPLCGFLVFWLQIATQLASFINLQRAVIGPSATLTGRQRPAIDLSRMLTGNWAFWFVSSQWYLLFVFYGDVSLIRQRIHKRQNIHM